MVEFIYDNYQKVCSFTKTIDFPAQKCTINLYYNLINYNLTYSKQIHSHVLKLEGDNNELT